ncbi:MULTISPECIES: hypothetical protein [unclassified Sphingomonas]|uniref:hypothetical protein n=1 Tax=unclassified Sphingomonas TaxID=196159 RepID=UPI00226A78F4|nr:MULTISPECIES: hypothetical protein [unclassified Sphingomonas]
MSKSKRTRKHERSAFSRLCRCHIGTCGENDMVMVERAIQLALILRPVSVEMLDAIDHLVIRAGVEFARDAVPFVDDKVPF